MLRWFRALAPASVLALSLALTGCGSSSTPQPDAPAQSSAATAGSASTSVSKSAGSVYTVEASTSKVTYSVREKFANRELPNDAVGSTSNIEGSLNLAPTGQEAPIRVDLRTLKSDENRRDEKLHRMGLESDTYSFAEFTLQKIEGLPAQLVAGQRADVKLTGSMKIHDTTKPLTFTGKIGLEGQRLHVQVSTQFDMNEFNVKPPSMLGMLTVDPGVKLDVDLMANPS